MKIINDIAVKEILGARLVSGLQVSFTRPYSGLALKWCLRDDIAKVVFNGENKT